MNLILRLLQFGFVYLIQRLVIPFKEAMTINQTYDLEWLSSFGNNFFSGIVHTFDLLFSLGIASPCWSLSLFYIFFFSIWCFSEMHLDLPWPAIWGTTLGSCCCTCKRQINATGDGSASCYIILISGFRKLKTPLLCFYQLVLKS